MTAPKLEDGRELVDAGLAIMEANRATRRARLNRPRWEPKKWHPVYEEIVMLSVMGYKNTDIAKEKGLTPVHVSNILNTPQAKLIIEIVLKKMEKKRELTVEQRLDRLATKAMDRVEEVIENDVVAEKNPLAMFDRALEILKGTKKIKTADAPTTNNTLIVTEDVSKQLIAALQLSDKARALHSGKQPVEVRADVIDP